MAKKGAHVVMACRDARKCEVVRKALEFSIQFVSKKRVQSENIFLQNMVVSAFMASFL